MTDTTEGTRVIASTVSALPGSARERFGDALAARYKSGGEWREATYGEVGEAIDEIALGLVALGIERGDRVCVLADTRLEWTLASYGISAAGGVVVPVYPTNSPKECQWVAGNSEARAVVVENATQAAKIDEIRAELPHLEHVIGMEPGVGELTVDQLRERGRGGDRGELDDRQSQVSPDDPYTIVYTSGTTGPPKGVVLTPPQRDDGVRCRREARVHPARRDHLPVPAARPRVRAARPARVLRSGHGDRLPRRRHQADPRRDRRDQADLPPVGPADLREDLRGRDEAAGAGERGGSRALRQGGRNSASRSVGVASAASRSRPSSRSRSSAPTESCFSASGSCSAARSARRSPAPPRSRRRSSSSSTPPAFRCSKAGA